MAADETRTSDAADDAGGDTSQDVLVLSDSDSPDDDLPQDEAPDAPQSQPAPARRRGLPVLAGLVLGGALAAALGFAAARYVVPDGWPFPGVTPEPDPLAIAQERQARELAALRDNLQALSGRVDALENDPRFGAMSGDIRQLQERLVSLSDLVNQLDARLLEVEKIPRGSGTEAAEAAAAAYERELSAMRQMLEQELAQIRAEKQDATVNEAEAEAQAARAAKLAAIAGLRAALEGGTSLADTLPALEQAGIGIPDDLARAAQDGVPTLAMLQEEFAPAARAALKASVAQLVEEGKISRFAGFLQAQLGKRSLEPREGDDPDAILSRAEAALKQGDVAGALAELDALPQAGRDAMADWMKQARARARAVAAVDALAAQALQQ